eukprot:365522-Chlamydomonas_euryale.AAC.9
MWGVLLDGGAGGYSRMPNYRSSLLGLACGDIAGAHARPWAEHAAAAPAKQAGCLLGGCRAQE